MINSIDRIQEVWNNLNGKTLDSLCDGYDTWAKSYDRDCLEHMEYKAPSIASKLLRFHLLQENFQLEEVEVLDVCSGTGLVAQSLKEAGFKSIDGVDGSKEMVNLARGKKNYNNLYCSILQEYELPVPGKSYSAATCIGGFGAGHLNKKHLYGILKNIQKGGILVLSLNSKYIRNLDFPTFIAQGLITVLEEKTEQYHKFVPDCQYYAFRVEA